MVLTIVICENNLGAPERTTTFSGAVGGNLIEDECPPCVSADFNGDGIVEAADLAELLGSWGPCPEPPELCPADLMGTGDGFVGADDLAFLLGAWGVCE